MAPKTVSQRLKKIDERLEALAQSVELLAAMQRKTERDIDRFVLFAQAVIERHDRRLKKLEAR